MVDVVSATRATPGMARNNAAEPSRMVPAMHLDHNNVQLTWSTMTRMTLRQPTMISNLQLPLPPLRNIFDLAYKSYRLSYPTLPGRTIPISRGAALVIHLWPLLHVRIVYFLIFLLPIYLSSSYFFMYVFSTCPRLTYLISTYTVCRCAARLLASYIFL